jgi:hypothetical protein
MAKDKQQEGIELDDDENKPDQEIFLGKEQRDPDEAVFAEQAIHHYAEDALQMFRDQVDSAMSDLSAFFSAQTQKEDLDNGFFLQELGDAFLGQALDAFGGADSPIGRALYSDLAAAIGQAAFTESSHQFVHELKTAMHEATHNVRENLDSMLSNEWDELRDLAYEGNTDFIAALHAYGLPAIDFDGKTLSQPMMDASQQYLDNLPKEKEESIDQTQVDEFAEQEAKMEEPEVQNLIEEEEEKEVVM